MKIAVFSDTHNNFANIKKALEWIQKQGIELVLHCGDTSSQEAIEKIKKFKGEAKIVKGNADWKMDDLPEKTEIELDGKKIAFCHFPDMAKKMAQSGNFDIVFYGHTHRAWDEKVLMHPKQDAKEKICHMVNPGELAGQFFKPTFAVYDTLTGQLELKVLEHLDP